MWTLLPTLQYSLSFVLLIRLEPPSGVTLKCRGIIALTNIVKELHLCTVSLHPSSLLPPSPISTTTQTNTPSQN
ncbi:hypothetical protein PGTUg99_028866 [Puccinia graminis f. sp. tritici]|uniref:Uncharacterized protein n=1 Tax=Puccinia graminis f. sp. tritici TaxID=56615 RepID=A0A5B0QM07_PUCGR|nr:hypothetical protein PGTUg99_028866 [Puccinia graminis f. sp. tritici]